MKPCVFCSRRSVLETPSGAVCSACAEDFKQDLRESVSDESITSGQDCRFGIDEECFCPECRLIADFEKAS